MYSALHIETGTCLFDILVHYLAILHAMHVRHTSTLTAVQQTTLLTHGSSISDYLVLQKADDLYS